MGVPVFAIAGLSGAECVETATDWPQTRCRSERHALLANQEHSTHCVATASMASLFGALSDFLDQVDGQGDDSQGGGSVAAELSEDDADDGSAATRNGISGREQMQESSGNETGIAGTGAERTPGSASTPTARASLPAPDQRGHIDVDESSNSASQPDAHTPAAGSRSSSGNLTELQSATPGATQSRPSSVRGTDSVTTSVLSLPNPPHSGWAGAQPDRPNSGSDSAAAADSSDVQNPTMDGKQVGSQYPASSVAVLPSVAEPASKSRETASEREVALEQQLSEVYAELMTLKRRHSELQARLRDSDVDAADAARAEAATLQNRVDSLEEDAAATRAAAASQTTAARQEVARAESALHSAMGELRSSRETSERREAELQSEIAELLRTLSAVRSECDRLRSRLASESAQGDGDGEADAGADALSLSPPAARALRAAAEESDRARKAAERDAASLRAALEAARATSDELRRDAASARAEAARAVSEAAGAERRAAEQADSQRVRQLHTRLDALARALREKQTELDAGSAGRAALMARLAAMGGRLEEAEAEAEAASLVTARGSAGRASGPSESDEDMIVFDEDEATTVDAGSGRGGVARRREARAVPRAPAATSSPSADRDGHAGEESAVPGGWRGGVPETASDAASLGTPSKRPGRAGGLPGSMRGWRRGRSVAVPVSRDSMLQPLTGSVPGAKRAIDAADKLCLQAGVRLVTRPRWRLLLMLYLLALHGMVLVGLSWGAHGSAAGGGGIVARPRASDLPGGGDHSGSVLESLRKREQASGTALPGRGGGDAGLPRGEVGGVRGGSGGVRRSKRKKSVWHHDASDLGA